MDSVDLIQQSVFQTDLLT